MVLDAIVKLPGSLDGERIKVRERTCLLIFWCGWWLFFAVLQGVQEIPL